MAILISGCVPIGSTCLVSSVLRSACARLLVISGSATPGSSVSLLASAVLSCVFVAYVGSYSGNLIVVFGWFVGLFSTYVQERDVNKHTQHVRARIAWEFSEGSFVGFSFVVFCICCLPR